MGLIWQPTLSHNPENRAAYEFSIEVDKEFARIMKDSKIDIQKQRRMRELGAEKVKAMGYNYPETYSFFEDSCLATDFHLGNNGLWLSMDSGDRNMKFERNPVYYSHNCDTSRDSLALMQLVSLWAEYAEIMRE